MKPERCSCDILYHLYKQNSLEDILFVTNVNADATGK
jgi:hypothetical protein